MMYYRDFERLIINDNPADNQQWKHILPTIPKSQRARFIKTYEEGYDIPFSYDLIMDNYTKSDKQYNTMLEDLASTIE